MKKKIILIISMIVITLLAFGGITWANEYSIKQAQERAIGEDPVMTNGIIRWETEGKKATSGIYYRTIGWNVHKEFVPSGNISKSGVKYGRMVMEQIGETPTTNGQVKTFFRVPKQDVDRALQMVSLEWQQGETVYLSAVTEVRQGTYDNYKVLGRYDNLQDLKKSQPWSKPDDFDQYFNRKIKLDFQPIDIVEVHLVNGREINRIDKGKKLPGEIHSTTIAKSIDFNGVSAELTKSYVEPFNRRGARLNPKGPVTERKDTVPPDDGMTVYIEYEMPFPFTVQHVNLDTGEIMESEVKTIEDLKTIIVEAKEFEGLHYQNSRVSRDSGSSWGNRSDKKSRTVTRKGGDLIIDGQARSEALKNGVGGIDAAALVTSGIAIEEEPKQEDQIEVHAFYLRENELGVDVITGNNEITFENIQEPIARIEKDLKLPVKEIYYYNQNGDLLKIEQR